MLRRCLIVLTAVAVVVALAAMPASAAIGPPITLVQVSTWGSTGGGNGQLADPQDIAVDPASGNVYVADTENERVQRFSADGTFLGAFDKVGTGFFAPTLEEPTAVAVGAGGVFVQDRALDQIARYSLTGTFLNKWSVPARAVLPPCNCAGREDLVADAAGNVFVLTATSSGQKYSPGGALLLTFTLGSGYNQGIALESDGEIVVTGVGGYLAKFSAAGAFVSSVQSGFSHLQSLAVDPAGNLWTFGSSNHLLSFTPSGGLRADTAQGSGQPQFGVLGSVAATGTAGIVVTSDWNDRVQKVAEGARLILVYNTDYSGDLDRPLTVSGPGATQSFLVDDDTDPALPNTRVAAPLVPGTWHAELGGGAQVKTITCSNGVQTTDYQAHAVDIALSPGQTVTCSFYAEWIG